MILTNVRPAQGQAFITGVSADPIWRLSHRVLLTSRAGDGGGGIRWGCTRGGVGTTATDRGV